MTEDWEASGWVVASISTLKMQNAYKVTINYEKPLEGKPPDTFVQEIWRSTQANWKPTGSMYKPALPRFVFISWWLREPSRKVNDLDMSFKRKCGVEETPDSSAVGTAGMEDDDPEAPNQGLVSSEAEENSSNSSVLISPPKRMRTKDVPP